MFPTNKAKPSRSLDFLLLSLLPEQGNGCLGQTPAVQLRRELFVLWWMEGRGTSLGLQHLV